MITLSYRNYSVCIPKEESATTVPGETPIWIDISEDSLDDALEFCKSQILNDRKNDLVVLYDKTLPEHLIRQVNQLKTPRTEGGFGWKKIFPWESFVGAECDTVIYVGTGSLEAFSRAKLKLMIITVTSSQGKGYSDSFHNFDACLRKAVEIKLLHQQKIVEEKQNVAIGETRASTLDSESFRVDSIESTGMLPKIHRRYRLFID